MSMYQECGNCHRIECVCVYDYPDPKPAAESAEPGPSDTDSAIDKAYLLGYEQANREWWAAARDGHNISGDPITVIPPDALIGRQEALLAVRRSRTAMRKDRP